MRNRGQSCLRASERVPSLRPHRVSHFSGFRWRCVWVRWLPPLSAFGPAFWISWVWGGKCDVPALLVPVFLTVLVLDVAPEIRVDILTPVVSRCGTGGSFGDIPGDTEREAGDTLCGGGGLPMGRSFPCHQRGSCASPFGPLFGLCCQQLEHAAVCRRLHVVAV